MGFLKYSFLKELVYELKEAAMIYVSVFLLAICLVVDWQHSPDLMRTVYAYYKQCREDAQTKRDN